MNDLISRQAAIDALNEQIEQCNKALGSFDISLKDEFAIKVERASLKAYKEQLENLPSAQPTQEIIHCKDCRFWKKYKYFNGKPTYAPFCGFNSIFTDDNDFCSRAERRGEADGDSN